MLTNSLIAKQCPSGNDCDRKCKWLFMFGYFRKDILKGGRHARLIPGLAL